MKKITLTRIGVSVALVSLVSAGVLVACSDDNNNPGPTADSGTDSDIGQPDAPVVDTGVKDSGKNVTVGLVHAAANLGPLLACYAIGSGIIGDQTNANRPVGPILPGIVGLFDSPLDLGLVDFTPFVLDATSSKVQAKLAAGKSCAELVTLEGVDSGGTDQLEEGVDYFRLPAVAKGTLSKNKTVLLAITGCSPAGAAGGNAGGGVAGNAAICGPNYDGGNPHGNLQLLVKVLSNDVTATGTSGVQFAHLSSEVSGLSPSVHVKNDGGAYQTVVEGATFGSILPAAPAAITGLSVDSTIRLSNAGDAEAPLPLVGTIDIGNASTQAASLQTEAGAAFWSAGSNYAYIIVGGPAGSYNPFPDGGYVNNHAAHLLVVKAPQAL